MPRRIQICKKYGRGISRTCLPRQNRHVPMFTYLYLTLMIYSKEFLNNACSTFKTKIGLIIVFFLLKCIGVALKKCVVQFIDALGNWGKYSS